MRSFRHCSARLRAFSSGPLVLLLAVLLASIGLSSTGNAKLRPYYIVENAEFADVQPRILFVLDTSGSMNWKSQATAEQCSWASCEDGIGSEQSRIAAAREALLQVIDGVGDTANFSLMTFEHNQAPTSVPPTCDDGNRFMWAEWYGHFDWAQIEQYSGYYGMWRLCDDVGRPYPYLRWDELGVGSAISANDQSGDVPASPLISTDETDMKSTTNAERRVQWFPQFMGVRAQLNATTDPDKSILYDTIGDWAATNAERDANVWRHDFYYWPYVDGFPGYASFVGWPVDDYPEWLGVAEEDDSISAASLYAPFYLDLSDTLVPTEEWGPGNSDDSLTTVRYGASPMIEGGVDAVGSTPWASAIGEIPGIATLSNASYSHSSVASYLKFVTDIDTAGACAPLTTVLITDGKPSPDAEGGELLHQRLAALRTTLGVKTYVVGFFLSGSDLNDMACAAAGACDGTCATPCDDTPENAWDTCADSDNPSTSCAFLADSPEALASVLTTIVTEEISTDIGTGTGSRLNDFGVGSAGDIGSGSTVQTLVSAYTEWPDWKGHVVRELCSNEDPDTGELAQWCQNLAFDDQEVQPTFGPCPQSREWDAGECLQQTEWQDRRIYSHTASDDVYRITHDDGTATTLFQQELEALGLLSDVDPEAEANAIAAFILGKDWPDGWKLPGLANAAPTVIRRIPKNQESFTPSVPIRDPHCSGRVVSEVDSDALAPSLVSFAESAWDEDQKLQSPAPHYEYQEAVLIGDDLGILHAFQLDSGNELWGFLPRSLLASAVQQYGYGAAAMGQPSDLADHIYGIAATLNQQWIFDDRGEESEHKWRHLGVFGLGIGGTELYALDLSHMSPESPNDPFDLLWTSESGTNKDFYDLHAGETWSRPAVALEVPENSMTLEPSARLVFGTGYAPGGGTEGRTLVMADALTGDPLDYAVIDPPDNRYGDYGTVVDPAVSSHCISRYWPEMQEVYVTDPAGQLFRWDLGNNHAADSGGQWGTQAQPVVQFLACQGTGDTCTVGPGNNGDVFAYGPAVTSNNRIDDPGGAPAGEVPPGVDQFLVALVSGATDDDDINGLDPSNDFHSSLYLLVDDHTSGEPHAGFSIPDGTPKIEPAEIGQNPHYLRLALSDLSRTRTYTPYEGSPTYVETASFSKAARPIRAPRIEVTGVVDTTTLEVIEGIEVYRVTYTIYEPGRTSCDPKWYDATADVWHYDEGAVYEITMRVTALDGQGFDFGTGVGDDSGANFGDGYETGLVLESVEQVTSDDCEDGNCGPKANPPERQPCNNNVGAQDQVTSSRSGIPAYQTSISGFSPLE